MKPLVFKLIIPITFISFVLFTKWWYVTVVDSPADVMYGFPLIYNCTLYGYSAARQFFIAELIIDVIAYFLIWFTVIYLINRFVTRIKLHIILTVFLYIISGLCIAFEGMVATMPDNRIYITRDFDVRVLETGYTFIWQEVGWPSYYKYFPEKKEQ